MSTHEDRLENLFCFAHEVLGYDKLGEMHVSWFDALLRHRFLLLLAPPRHFKSTVCTVVYPLWRLKEDHNTRALLVNEVLDNSKAFLREIKGHLQQSPKFRSRFGEWDLHADAWTEERILIPRSAIRKEPSIAVASVLGTVVSVHPSLIVVDDPCSNRNTQTPHQRQKVIQWFQRDLLPRLDHGGQIIVVMTRWHTDDLAGWIMANPGYEDWKVINLAAEWQDEKGTQHILFPERFTKEDLAREKARLGTANYNCLWLNDPSGQEGSDFKAAWLDSGRYDQLPAGATVYSGVDLAIGRSEGNSRFAIVTIALDRDGTAYVVNAYRDRIPFTEQLKAVKRIHKHYHPQLIAIESNGFQAAFIEALRTDPETKLLPIKPVNTQGDKHARIRGLAPLFENGSMRLPKPDGTGWAAHLEEELLHFPHGTEDMLDALWLALQAVEAQRIVPCIRFADDL
ncbi:MAG: phage terminase large subunit [Elusimicrobia bacterium]|nr:phage terminase large subunit [Elusimicrobiota bacterium]